MNLLLRISASSLARARKKSEKEVNSNQSNIPTPDAVSQWGVKAQQDLANYEKTGKLPEGMFTFD
ncbi:MAG: hypothetical protein RL368_1913 [Pseudomonadota bacterium]|jgi:hypothetical protein